MRLQIPIGLIVGLPDTAEIRLAAYRGGPRALSLTYRLILRLPRRPREPHCDHRAGSSRNNSDGDHRTQVPAAHDNLLPYFQSSYCNGSSSTPTKSVAMSFVAGFGPLPCA